MAHLALAGRNLPLPHHAGVTFDPDMSRDGVEIGIDDQLGTDGASAQFRSGEIQIIGLLELMVGELIADRHADAVRRAIRADDVDAGDLGFFAAIFRVAWHNQRLAGRP